MSGNRIVSLARYMLTAKLAVNVKRELRVKLILIGMFCFTKGAVSVDIRNQVCSVGFRQEPHITMATKTGQSVRSAEIVSG